jgi:hypothetical protein
VGWMAENVEGDVSVFIMKLPKIYLEKIKNL